MLRVCLNWSSTASLEGRIFNKGSYATFWWLAHQLWTFHTRQNWAEKNPNATQNNIEMENCHHFTWLSEIWFYSSNQPSDLTDPEWRSKGSFQLSSWKADQPNRRLKFITGPLPDLPTSWIIKQRAALALYHRMAKRPTVTLLNCTKLYQLSVQPNE